MSSEAKHECVRCGLPVYEWGGMCGDCRWLVRELNEADRWASDYSREERRRMGSVILSWRTNVSAHPLDRRPPRRDRPNRSGPMDLSAYDVDEPDPEWAIVARRRFAQMPQQPAVIEHAVGLTGRQTDPVCREGHTKTPGNDGRLRCLPCEAERARTRRAQRQEAS